MRRPAWTPAMQAEALKQGWGLFTASFIGKDVTVIQRLDDPSHGGVARRRHARFPTDEAAAAYVVGRAEMGDPLAHRALRVIDTAYRNIGHRRRWNMLVA